MMDASLPERPWTLSAPESLVLLWGPSTGDTWALSLAILELAVRHDLSLRAVQHRKLLIFPRDTLVLTGSLRLSAIIGAPLRAVFTAKPMPVRYERGVTGVPIDAIAQTLLAPEVVRTARNRTRNRSGPVYVPKYVIPSLVERGLYTWDFPTIPPALTPKGQETLAELRHLLAVGRETFPFLVERDPGAAWTYLDHASSALLLVRGLPVVIERLVKLHGRPASWAHALDASQSPMHAADASDPIMPPLSVDAFLRPIGPEPYDDLDMALHAITTEVERKWLVARRGEVTFGGE